MRVDGGRLHEDLALNSSNAVNRSLCCSSAVLCGRESVRCAGPDVLATLMAHAGD